MDCFRRPRSFLSLIVILLSCLLQMAPGYAFSGNAIVHIRNQRLCTFDGHHLVLARSLDSVSNSLRQYQHGSAASYRSHQSITYCGTRAPTPLRAPQNQIDARRSIAKALGLLCACAIFTCSVPPPIARAEPARIAAADEEEPTEDGLLASPCGGRCMRACQPRLHSCALTCTAT